MDSVSPQHGGDLTRAIAHWGGKRSDWLDCSASIASHAYPLPDVPAAVWHDLPHADAELLAAASSYYGCRLLIAVPGSQAAIRILPTLRRACCVGIVSPTYAEHAWQWRQAGHAVREIAPNVVDAHLPDLDVLIIVNPNNPTGMHWPRATLLNWQATLARHGGWLIVDEAFADALPQESLVADAGLPGLIVLRSIGKFFGLAGLRLGFVAAENTLLVRLAAELGPWAISGPAQWAGTLALQNFGWHENQRQRLADDARWLATTLAGFGLEPAASLPLLCWCPTTQAPEWQNALAGQRIWCRRFEKPAGLRFGPVAARDEFIRQLELASQKICKTLTETTI